MDHGAQTQIRLSVIIPAYNERGTVLTVVAKLVAAPLPAKSLQILIVNDGSDDGTAEILDSLLASPDAVLASHFAHLKTPAEAQSTKDVQIQVFHHEKNLGKSRAIRTAIKAVTGDVVLIQDADLEYSPLDIPSLLKPILQGKADIVYGSRFQGSSRRVLFFWHAAGNRIVTTLANIANNLNLTDVMTGYKAFRSRALTSLALHSEGFGFEIEVTAKIARLNFRLYEVPISYFGRSYVDGKKIRWWHGLMAICHILRHFFLPGRALRSDLTQLETLEDLFAVHAITDHTYESVRHILGSRILEVGSGTGNMTAFLLRHGDVTASDISDEALGRLSTRFADRSNLKVQQWDLAQPFPGDASFDTVVCINVLEHIEDDHQGLRHILDLLEPGGRLILLVPQGMWLYGPFDKKIGHYRRYREQELRDLLLSAGFEIRRLFDFNGLGVPGWWFNAKVMKKDSLSVLMLRLYNFIGPPCLWLERKITPPYGLSLVADCTARNAKASEISETDPEQAPGEQDESIALNRQALP